MDNYECQAIRADTGQKCRERATDVDHKIELEDNHDIDQLQSLCAHHHRQKTSYAGGMIGAQKRKKAAPRHPGIIP